MIAESLRPNREVLAKPEMLQAGSRIVLICDGAEGNGINASNSASPGINGVKTTLENVQRVLNQRGYETILFNPSQYMNVPLPTYPDFRFALVDPHQLRSKLIALQPNGILNMSPEGGIGFSSLRACGHFPYDNLVNTGRRLPYTASYTTNLDQYPSDYIQTVTQGKITVPPDMFHPLIRRIYENAYRVMAPTKRMEDKLKKIGIDRTVLWPRGVDTKAFHPRKEGEENAFKQYFGEDDLPILLYFGRVAREKNLDAFLSLQTPEFRKVVIGKGPYLEDLRDRYASDITHFLGPRYAEDLAWHVRSARLMVFPSKSETWGQVATEAAASGLPVVAYDVQGPGDVIDHGINGILVQPGASLLDGIKSALNIDRERCAKATKDKYSWENACDIVLTNLQPIIWKNRGYRLKYYIRQ